MGASPSETGEIWLYQSSSNSEKENIKILSNGAVSLAFNSSGSRLLYQNPRVSDRLYGVKLDGTEDREVAMINFLGEKFTLDSHENIVYYIHTSTQVVHFLNLGNGDSDDITDSVGKNLDIDEDNRYA